MTEPGRYFCSTFLVFFWLINDCFCIQFDLAIGHYLQFTIYFYKNRHDTLLFTNNSTHGPQGPCQLWDADHITTASTDECNQLYMRSASLEKSRILQFPIEMAGKPQKWENSAKSWKVGSYATIYIKETCINKNTIKTRHKIYFTNISLIITKNSSDWFQSNVNH